MPPYHVRRRLDQHRRRDLAKNGRRRLSFEERPPGTEEHERDRPPRDALAPARERTPDDATHQRHHEAERCRQADELGEADAGIGRDLLDERVALGVDGGGVERVRRAGDAEKAGGLLVGLGPQARHLLQGAAGAEGALLHAVRHDRLRQRGTQPGHVAQQRG